MVVFNSVVDVDTLDYFAVSAKDWLIKGSHSWNLNQQFDFATIVPKNKFLCLMRRPSVSRAKLGQFLIENIGLENVLMSFGSMSQFGLKGYRSYFPNHELPILIDGLVSTGEMSWKLHGNGKSIGAGEVVAPDERLSWPLTIGLGLQHIAAMFGATFLVPIITKFPPTTTLFFSGVGTILFLLLTRNRVPS